MATLVSDIITQAFLDMGAIAPGETITTAEQTDAFLRLNQMLKSWSTEKVSVFDQKHGSFALSAGTTDYTFGVGGNLNTAARPVRVMSAVSVSGSFRGSVKVLSFPQFAAEVSDPLGEVSVLARMLAADNAFPLINLRVFPVPAAGPGSLLLDYWTAIAAFAAVGDTVTMPEGFEDALHFNLAVRLYPQYARKGGIPVELAEQASTTKASIVALYADILGVSQAPAAKK